VGLRVLRADDVRAASCVLSLRAVRKEG
jgi:hypothetical protein